MKYIVDPEAPEPNRRHDANRRPNELHRKVTKMRNCEEKHCDLPSRSRLRAFVSWRYPGPRSSEEKRPTRRAFVAVDMVFGIIIVAGVTVALIKTVHHEQAGERALSDSRGAVHLAEHALLNLQHGQPLPATTIDQQLSIHLIAGGTAPAGFIWVSADAAVHSHRRSLLGVVPAGSVPAGTK